MLNPFRTHPNSASAATVVVLFAALIYLPPLFDDPEKAVLRSQRECAWAIQTRSSMEAKCQPFLEKAQKFIPTAGARLAADAWMQIAEYRLVQGNVEAARIACHEALRKFAALDTTTSRLSNAENAKKICEAFFAKYGS